MRLQRGEGGWPAKWADRRGDPGHLVARERSSQHVDAVKETRDVDSRLDVGERNTYPAVIIDGVDGLGAGERRCGHETDRLKRPGYILKARTQTPSVDRGVRFAEADKGLALSPMARHLRATAGDAQPAQIVAGDLELTPCSQYHSSRSSPLLWRRGSERILDAPRANT